MNKNVMVEHAYNHKILEVETKASEIKTNLCHKKISLNEFNVVISVHDVHFLNSTNEQMMNYLVNDYLIINKIVFVGPKQNNYE